MLTALFIALVLFILLQAVVSTYLNVFIWEDPDRLAAIRSPKLFLKEHFGFTLLVPARHEEAVIKETIIKMSQIRYPKNKYQILVICEHSDKLTITQAKNAIREHKMSNARVITFSDRPINKPHALNIGLKKASHEIITIFDAEDEVQADILQVANTLLVSKKIDILQAGVQLMDYDSHWYSAHNVLEYYFWFKSRLFFHAHHKVVPLGGNTVFFKKSVLQQLNGWDENCLTEDAEIGIRLTSQGASCLTTYDPVHATQEETPSTVGSFIRQRTRWNQGFIQVLLRGDWRAYPSVFQKILAFYTLSYPIQQALIFILTPPLLILGLVTNLSVMFGMLSFLPLLMVLVHASVAILAMHEFITDYDLKHRWWVYPWLVLSLIPFQILLGISAVRATWRVMRGINEWEKTQHLGLHRSTAEADSSTVAKYS
ncbi:MAG: glycosyltransferase [Patescibacteria group bacterium]